MLMKNRNSGPSGSYSYGNYGSGSGSGGSYGTPDYMAVRRYIDAGNLTAAENILNSTKDRSAECCQALQCYICADCCCDCI